MRETETTVKMLSTIRSSYEGGNEQEAPQLVAQYNRLIVSNDLTLRQMQAERRAAIAGVTAKVTMEGYPSAGWPEQNSPRDP